VSTLTDLLPVRIGLGDRTHRPARKHRAVDEVTRLRSLLDGANTLIRGLQLQVAERDTALAETAAHQAEAEELVVQQMADIDDLTAERDELLAEVLKFRARFGPQLAAEANANRITVPPMVRDTTAIEDQATGPIDVRPLWDAHGIRPVTDPGEVH
jgi:ATP-dependent helicase YprA (DUF1998 family)